MAVPPPPQLTEDDDGRAGSTVRGTRGTRRGRWKLAIAALPLLFAAALFLVNIFGVAGDRGEASDRGEGGDGSADGTARATEISGSDASTATAAVAAPEGLSGPEPAPDTSAPVPPAGYRAVAVRFAAPDAVDLVATGDRIDVVGLDGGVLAADLEVLQDRSTGQARILVLAVRGEHAPELAAVAAAQDLTLLVAHTAG